MNSFEFNKMAGAVLGTALVVFGLNELAKTIYHSELPAKPGYAIEVADAAAAAGGEAKASEGEQAAESLGALLASADAAKGQAVSKACASCHDFTEGGPNKVGPNLYGVVGRNHASHEGFTYSEGMSALKDKQWTYEALNEFIKDPKGVVKGTKMSFGGIKKDKERADLLAYLGSLSKTPVPFPAP